MNEHVLNFKIPGLCAVVAALILTSGCGKDTPVASEDTDLSQSKDLFDKPQTSPAAEIQPNMAVARVNGEEILFEDVQQAIQNMLASSPRVPPPEVLQEQMPQLLSRSLNNIITKLLVEDAIESEEISVPDSEVEKRLRQVASSIPGGKKLSEILAERGITRKEFRAGLAEEMAIQKLVEEHTSGIEDPSNEEVREFYEENPERFEMPASATASHILIGFDDNESDAGKADKLEEIKVIRKKILSGADFEEMARKHSTGPSAEKGGNLGRFPRGRMLEPFDEAVFNQEIGAVGEPVETKFGYHIIRVEEREDAGKLEFEKAKNDIKSYLEGMRKQEALQEYMQQLNDKADIEILHDLSKVNLKVSQVAPETGSEQ